MKRKPKPSFLASVINIEAFAIVLLGGALLSWSEPVLTVSEFEKRDLAPFPTFSWPNLFEGNYTDSLDLYYSDHFAHREGLVEFASTLKSSFGFRKNDLMVYQSQNPDMVGLDSIPPDSLNSIAKDSASQKAQIKKDPTGKPPEVKNSIMIYNGMAFQLFGRYNEAENNFANTVNSYKQKLGDSVRVFVCLAPSSIDFYLPDEYKSKSSYEKPSIGFIYSKLTPSILAVDAYSNLENHTDDFIYFKTDHHWTARGAYLAYLAFCKKAGFDPVGLTSFQRHVKKKFLGSLYYATLDPRLKSSNDSLEYFIPPLKVQAWRHPEKDLQKIIPTELVSKRLGRAGTYLTFIGGDYPLTHIITENKNGKRIFIIKDSYGNAVVPFLVMHYEEIFVADYRSFDSNTVSFMMQHNVQDLLFLHNIAIANTKYTASRESYLTRVKDLKPVLKQDTTVLLH
jgi:hypothetical protein